MNAERMVGQDEPLMIAWNAYKATEEYANSRQWAEYKAHLDGSLWAAFCAGYAARDDELRKQEPSPTAWMTAVKDRIRWLSRSLEKALTAPIPPTVQEPWCMKMNDCSEKCEDCPDAAPIPPEPMPSQQEALNDLRELDTNFEFEGRMAVLRNHLHHFILARPDANQWQPIETAPKDGRLMIAHNLIMNSTYVVGWDAGNKDDEPHWSDVPNRNAAESLWFNERYFSLWMPLPARPDEVKP